MPGPTDSELGEAAQSREEAMAFIEAFARMNIESIRETLARPTDIALALEHDIDPDWTSGSLLAESGLTAGHLKGAGDPGERYIHIDVALDTRGKAVTDHFLGLTGLSDKQQRTLFPVLSTTGRTDRGAVAAEVSRLNAWLDWVRRDGFDPNNFAIYQRGISMHGKTQNRTGAIGAAGAAIAFVDAIRSVDPDAIIDRVGSIPPDSVRAPAELLAWSGSLPAGDTVVKALLLKNGRALVFASSKDANIFMPLGTPYASAEAALRDYNSVRNDTAARQQRLHEFAVGEVKTATDLANLHERMGLASRETQTELRTDRFLMMAVLNREILGGGTAGRTLNNRDLVRFTQVFNLHHCWGWDGGRERHPGHWDYFVSHVRRWCGI